MKYTTLRGWIQTYFTSLVLKPAQFADTNKGFKYNIDQLKKDIKSLDPNTWYLVMDEPRGTFDGTDNSNLIDTNRIGFWVLHYVELDDWASEDLVHDGAKIIGEKLFSRAYNERLSYNGLFKKFNPVTINWQKAGPELTNWFGAYFSFDIPDNANINLVFDPTDWP